ncbi:hypothetical protein LMG19145_02489 [Xanthomonas arboricola pv. fragariae]|nr:hypothetical protein LMG19145_02489 [Xanthomonas arboricola pv. fragariae]
MTFVYQPINTIVAGDRAALLSFPRPPRRVASVSHELESANRNRNDVSHLSIPITPTSRLRSRLTQAQ